METSVGINNIGIVVKDLKATIAFFLELGLEIEGQATVEGNWVDRIVGLDKVHNDIAMMKTPDGHGRIELIQFNNPEMIPSEPNTPVNTQGIRRIMFSVKNIKDVVARLEKIGAELLGEIITYGDTYQLCYIRGPEGIIIALAEPLQ